MGFTRMQLAILAALALAVVVVFCIGGMLALSTLSPTLKPSDLVRVIEITPIPTTAPSSTTRKWYTGGNLHRASIAEWKRATYEDKFTTAADWTASTRKGKTAIQSNGSEGLKPYAIDLVNCIDKSTAGNLGYNSSGAAEIAAICTTMMGWD